MFRNLELGYYYLLTLLRNLKGKHQPTQIAPFAKLPPKRKRNSDRFSELHHTQSQPSVLQYPPLWQGAAVMKHRTIDYAVAEVEPGRWSWTIHASNDFV